MRVLNLFMLNQGIHAELDWHVFAGALPSIGCCRSDWGTGVRVSAHPLDLRTVCLPKAISAGARN